MVKGWKDYCLKLITLITPESGWVVKGLKCAHLSITKYTPMRIGKHFPLPPALKKKKHALLNIKNKDNRLVIVEFK